MLAALGPFRFDITGISAESIDRDTGARWPAHAVVGGPPLLEFVGPDTETVTIKATLYPRVLHPTAPAQLAALRAVVKAGRPMMFVLATGGVVGRVAVESVRDAGSHHAAAGDPQRLAATLTLKATGQRGSGFAGLLSLF